VRGSTKAVCVFIGRPENHAELKLSAVPPLGRSWHISMAWLISRERDFPNDAPTWEEMTFWFACCILYVFGGAALLTGLVLLPFGIVNKRWKRRTSNDFVSGVGPSSSFRRPLAPAALFWTLAFILGFLGPNVASAWLDRCMFTWPACLFVVFDLTLQTCLWAVKRSEVRKAKWLARGSILGMVLAGYGYFELCKLVGMFVAWSFLIGFLPAFPITAWAVRAQMQKNPGWMCAAWTLLAFAVFFWSAQGFLLWKTSTP
jgi:hypothetical protein